MKCDLHVHTDYSYDSTSHPHQIVERALEEGIDCLAVTDHGEIKGALAAADYAADKSVLIITGIEVKSKSGDIIGLDVREIVPDGLSAAATIAAIKGQGGLAVIPHPFSRIYGFKGEIAPFLGTIDAVEVKNSLLSRAENERAWRLAKENGLAFTAGSDAHSLRGIGRVFLEIPGSSLAKEKVLEAIRLKNAVPAGREADWTEKTVRFCLRAFAKLRHYVGARKRKV
jgi:predicted metal-dependent phosphoesterase TrpH